MLGNLMLVTTGLLFALSLAILCKSVIRWVKLKSKFGVRFLMFHTYLRQHIAQGVFPLAVTTWKFTPSTLHEFLVSDHAEKGRARTGGACETLGCPLRNFLQRPCAKRSVLGRACPGRS
jgi:hypothetical protein